MLPVQKQLLLKKTFYLRFLLPLIFLISSCSPLIAPYNEHVYRELASLKVETTTLVGKASEEYSSHEAEVQALDKDLSKLYEYMKALPKNTEATKMMEIMIKGEGSWGGIKNLWKTKGKLSPAAVTEFQDAVTTGFNDMIELESKKIK
ncbi:hypothetical protein C3K47_13240 [Solitalea longa]|uniref:Uncharacterized protein n=1 Tax=Solitalea longa TaxID=2079460 RepID=A0A2S5A072_9SPHI|nr:hypothetical protein [Solitalea longa]POY35719.1 hypothetical protein C3K47_13240 [Solitalea longa]